MGNVLITNSGLPDDYCFTNPQQFANDLAAVLEGNFVYTTLFSTGNSTPAVTLQSRPWFRYNSDGTPDDWYVFASGNWLAKHPLPTGAVMMYEGTEASIVTFDGGEAGAITPTTGAFWEKVSALDARFPIGPGTLPSGLVVPIAGTGGEETHAITIPELPTHKHTVDGFRIGNLSGGDNGAVLNDPAGTHTAIQFDTSEVGDGDAMSLLPPYYGIWFIKRTARLYRRQ